MGCSTPLPLSSDWLNLLFQVMCPVDVAGTLPAWANMSRLSTLRLFANRLEGTLPAAWGSMALTELRLDVNMLQVRGLHSVHCLADSRHRIRRPMHAHNT